MQVIVYKQDSGQVAVCVPTQEALARYSIRAIADKDVPAGKPYAIVDSASLPLSTRIEAWVVDDEDLTDGVGSESDEFPPEDPQ